LAARNGHDDVLSYLLRRCREIVNARTVDGYTALHLACMGKYPEAVRVLIEDENVDPDVQTEMRCGGKTPLHFAAAFGFAEGVRMLLESGRVNKEICAANSMKAVEIARNYNRYAVVKLLAPPAPPPS
jgi:ankyrin repeat protein